MSKNKRNQKEKQKLHPNNPHHGRYQLQELAVENQELTQFLIPINETDFTINFADPDAVKSLNKALLSYFYNVKNWDIPENYLCPPIPGRADYIHNIADLLKKSYPELEVKGKHIKILDIGVGANCVYPLIGTSAYAWNFVGVDIDERALDNAKNIINANPQLEHKIKFRLQTNPKQIFKGAIEKTERFEVSICNPPFYASLQEAQQATIKKLGNLHDEKVKDITRNFGGQSRELWTHGGEGKFISDMIIQSKEYHQSCLWFTTLVSNKAHLKNAYALLEKLTAVEIITIPMGQGNKISRVLAWTFLTPAQQQKWLSKPVAK